MTAGPAMRLRRGVLLSALAALNIVLLVTWQWLVLTTLGPGTQTDALFAGMILPNFVLAVLGGSLVNVLLPMLSAVPPAELPGLRAELSVALLMGFSAAAAVLAVSAPVWIVLVAPGFAPEGRVLAVQLARIQLVGLALSGALSVQATATQATGGFIRVELSQVAASAASLGVLVWAANRFGVLGVAFSAVLRVVLQLLLLVPFRHGAAMPRFGGAAFGEIWRRLKPLLGASLYYKSDAVLDRMLASYALPGALSLYHVAQQVLSSGQQVLQRSMVAPTIAGMSRALASEGEAAMRRQLVRALTTVVALAVAASLVLVVAGEPILRVVFVRGAMTTEQVRWLWIILLLLSGVWLGSVLGMLLSSSFYVLGDVRTPTRIGVLGFTVAIGLKLAAFRLAGVAGLALAASAYYLMNASAVGVALWRRLPRERMESR
jgi:putative peptidoglycan lipid II flippase